MHGVPIFPPVPAKTKHEKKAEISADRNTQFLQLEIENNKPLMYEILSSMHSIITMTQGNYQVVQSPWIPVTEWNRLVMDFAILGCKQDNAWSPFHTPGMIANVNIKVDNDKFYLYTKGDSGSSSTELLISKQDQEQNHAKFTANYPIRQILESCPSCIVSECVRFMVCSANPRSPLIIEYKLEDPVYKRWPSQTYFIHPI
jgi:hypothetical protein